MRLRDAYERYRLAAPTTANAYDWYRRPAKAFGHVSLEGTPIKAWKSAGAWFVDAAAVQRALAAHRANTARSARATRDLQRGVVHGFRFLARRLRRWTAGSSFVGAFVVSGHMWNAPSEKTMVRGVAMPAGGWLKQSMKNLNVIATATGTDVAGIAC
jgi:hypothetical protein